MVQSVQFGRLGFAAFAVMVGCSASATPAPTPAATYGLTAVVNPGEEWTQCQFVQVPPEGMIVNHATVEWTKGNHHTILYTTSYTDIPTKDLTGTTVDTSKPFNCNGLGVFNWSVNGYLVLAQSADTGNAFSLPPDVGFKLAGGSIMVLSVHQINTSQSPITAESRVNLFTIPESALKQEAGLMYFYNYFIDVPAHASAPAREICPITKDVTLTSIQSHTHARGVSTVANIVDGDGNTMDTLYQNSQAWDNASVLRFPNGKQLTAGTGMDFTCNYQNNEDSEVEQGPNAAAEMCAMIGIYYPRDIPFEECDNDGTFLLSSTAARHIGSGTASCMDTIQCLNKATPFAQDTGASMGPCFRNSCPAASKAIKAVTDCTATLKPTDDPTMVCGSQLAACASTACQ